MLKNDFMLRLMKYKRLLIQLRTLGLEKVFSNNLGDAIGVSAALVRKDLARIEIQGNRRGGYSISSVLERLNGLFGGNGAQKAVLAGCGNLGRALLNYSGLSKDDISIAAAFDLNPPAEDIGGTPVLPDTEMEEYIRSHQIKAALLSVPASAAAGVRDRLFDAGIKGILNFAPVDLKCPQGCIVQNVNIGLEIENLFFLVNTLKAGAE